MSDTPKSEPALHDDPKVMLTRAQLRADKAELEVTRLRQAIDSRQGKFALLQRALDGGRVVVWIVASWVPLTAVQPIASSFAGEDTKFEAGLTISFTFSLFVSVALAVTLAQSRLRKKKIQRQRERLDKLEAQLLQQRQRIDGLESELRRGGAQG